MSLKRAVRSAENLVGKVLKAPLSFFDVQEEPGKFFRGVVKKRSSHKPGHWVVRYTDGTEYNLPETSIKKWICSTAEVKDNSWAYELSDVDNSASASEEVEDPSSDNTPFEEPGSRPAASANVPRQRVPETAVTKPVWDTRKTKESNPISFTATSGFVKEPPADAGVSYFFEELWWLSKPGTYPQRETRGATSQRWRSLWDFLLEQSELYATQKQAGEVTPTVQAHKRFKDAGKHRAYESPSLSTMLRAHALKILHSAIRTTGGYQPWSTAGLRGKFLRIPQIANVISSGKLQQFWRYFHAADNSNNAEKKKLPTGEDSPNYDNLYKPRVVHDCFQR
ncbi:hypothetical protein CYMTET_54825 [Cymbomonas tetramitiformis]|uniref:Uncharacterized protein n=1 Tax=Cymbomonas tetramitiformis TaxID=36881 RepID=A0AAE0BEE6_9CHLO|nr:hypothetical protein CYMTET_54825 [Cymbomonas tetramitiformis]